MSDGDNLIQPGFEILRHYLRDLSFENPQGPMAEDRVRELVFSLQVSGASERLPEEAYRMTLIVQASGRVADRVVILAEIEYVADLKLHLVPEPVVDHVLGVEVPKVMVEFVRRVLEQNCLFAGFPPIRIGDVDFRAIHYAQPRPPVPAS